MTPTERSILGRSIGTAVVFVLIVSTIAAGVGFEEIPLTSILLVLFVEVELVALLANTWMSVVAAVGAVAATNWFLVPPFHSFFIADGGDLVALAVFVAGALTTSWLVGRAQRTRSQAVSSRREVEAYHALLRSDWPRSDPGLPLSLLLDATGLDEVQLRDAANETVALARREDLLPETSEDFMVIDEELPGGYLLVGVGSARMHPDRQLVVALGTAAVRSLESREAQGT